MEKDIFYKRTEFWVLFLYAMLEFLVQNGTVVLKSTWQVAAVVLAYIIGRSLVKAAQAFGGVEGLADEVVDAIEEIAEVTKEAPIIKPEKKEPTVVVTNQEKEENDV